VVPYHRRLLAVCALQDGRFAVSDEDRTIRLYKIVYGSREFDSSFEVIDTQPSVVYSLVQLPDGLLAGADESCVRVWDTDTRACILSLPYSNIMHLQVIHSRLAVISPSLTFVE
jgi:WD40 repeat protein